MYKIAVLGDYGSIYGFATLGLDAFPMTDTKEAAKTLHRLAVNQYGIIYITDELAERLKKEIESYKEALLPTIIVIPGVYGNTKMGVENIKKSVEQAVGSDILFTEK